MARVLVIGGTGFIGSHAVRSCVRAGHQVWVGTGTLRPGLLDDVRDQVQFVPANLLRWPDLLEALTTAQPDVVISCAAFGAGGAGLMRSAEDAPSQAVELNVGGFTNLLEAVRLLKVPRLVWTSSSVVFGPATAYPAGPVDEEVVSQPTTVYGATKTMAEFLARHYRHTFGVESVALRLPLVYGPGRWYVGQGGALHHLFQAAAARQPVRLEAPPTPIDLMYGPDAGDAIEACVSASTLPHDRYHVLSHRSAIAELAEALRAADPALAIDISPILGDPALPAMATVRIERDLGYRPHYDARRACAHFLACLRQREEETTHD